MKSLGSGRKIDRGTIDPIGRHAMRWDDRVYGESTIDDPGALALIHGPTFARLGRIRQAGPSAIAFPFKTVTRREHSLGVYLLLGRLGARHRERIAGLLHDLSHTAFSHAVDFVVASEEQDHHERLKPEFLHRPDVVGPLSAMGYAPEEFYDDAIYPLLERPLPWLCADRVDYFLRDSLATGVSTPMSVRRTLDALVIAEGTIALNDIEVARDLAARFAEMNRDWWASPTEAYVYNEFADALREGFRCGALCEQDLLGDDEAVLSKLRDSGNPAIATKLDCVANFRVDRVVNYRPRVAPKDRRIDPPVVVAGELRRLSELK